MEDSPGGDTPGDGRSRLGIALGGGGARAFVHLGVLSRLEEEGLRPGYISGSSMGAVLGALYADEPHRDTTIPRILDYFRNSSLFGRLIKQDKGDGLHNRPGWLGNLIRKLATFSVAAITSFRLGLRRHNPVNNAIDEFFSRDARNIESLTLPFGVNSLNLTRGRLEEHMSGPLAPALKAGVAIGLVLAPFVWHDEQYADAAPIAPVPVRLCRHLGATVVLGVDICAPLVSPLPSHSGFDVVRRILSMQTEALNNQETAEADVLLKIDVSDVFWADFSRIDYLVERGREAAGTIVEQLRSKLSETSDSPANRRPS